MRIVFLVEGKDDKRTEILAHLLSKANINSFSKINVHQYQIDLDESINWGFAVFAAIKEVAPSAYNMTINDV